jgi:NADP-dependent 3-hydroxy acid dehydrogenase YdfG
MKAKADLIEEILGLCPNDDLEELRKLTSALVSHRDSPDSERFRFETTQDRCIPGYGRDLLPSWNRVLVTGGTGCVGHCVLKHLVDDLPDATLLSVARRRPVSHSRLDRVTYMSGDVRSSQQMTELMQDFRPDLVIHLAAQRNPALAEEWVDHTVSTNNLGTQIVLDAAGAAGVKSMVVASTGKTVRFFTRDVYAATKKLVEYQAAGAAKRYDGMRVSCARFTHVVDNSLVAQNILKWIDGDEPIRLHSPLVQLPVQSALECFQLLMVGAISAEPGRSRIVALRDLGWPPIDLLELTLDYLAAAPRSLAPIVFTGYPQGYEAEAYPGTYDPMTAGQVSPLVNCAEAMSTEPTPVLGQAVDFFETTDTSSEDLDERLAKLTDACRVKKNDRVIGNLLREASEALLQHSMEQLDAERIRRIHRLGRRHNPLVEDHAFIHRRLEELLSTGPVALV